MERLLLIYNPNSGDGKVRTSLADLVETFAQVYEVEVHPTQRPKDATEFLKEKAHLFSHVVACGGDGLLHEVINGLDENSSACRLTYIPTGTTNDFANTHHIPRDLLEAARLGMEKNTEKIDLAEFNGERFTYVAACGISTEVSYTTGQEEKKKLGPLAYVRKALNSVDYTHWENNCVSMKIDWEDGSSEGDFLFAALSNSRYIGGMDNFSDDLFMWNDGLIEGFFIRRPMNLVDLNIILAGILRKDYSSPLFLTCRSPWFHVEADSSPWTLDGEYGGAPKIIDVHVIPQALNLSRISVEEDPHALNPQDLDAEADVLASQTASGQ